MGSNKIFKIVLGVLFVVFGANIIMGTNRTKSDEEEAYNEVVTIMVTVDANERISEENDGKVIAVSGKLNLDDLLVTDELTGFGVGAAYLQRKVESYQWVKDCGENGDDCKYKKEWSAEKVDSSTYDDEHQNSDKWSHESKDIFDDHATIGVYSLSEEIVKQLPLYENTHNSFIGTKNNEWENREGYFYNTSSDEPKIGDIRIKYYYSEDEEVSILAKLNGSTLEPYIAKNGRPVSVVHKGKYDAEALLKMYYNHSTLSNIIMTILGLALVAVGIFFFVDVFGKKKATK